MRKAIHAERLDAYLLVKATGNLLQTFDNPTATDDDFFGTSVAIDGGYVLVGAPGDREGNPFGSPDQYVAYVRRRQTEAG